MQCPIVLVPGDVLVRPRNKQREPASLNDFFKDWQVYLGDLQAHKKWYWLQDLAVAAKLDSHFRGNDRLYRTIPVSLDF